MKNTTTIEAAANHAEQVHQYVIAIRCGDTAQAAYHLSQMIAYRAIYEAASR